ncbi:MAG: TIGR03663 family protein, partial [Ardenticatenales bacterium]|nr:TIGR03663 family protein [Ardenticatenales bacterium]
MEQPVEIRRTPWLDLPLGRLLVLDRTMLLFGLILLLTVISRFWDLGSRALHHDESLHAVYSYTLYDRGEYRHEPLMHGPMLFHLTAFGYWLFGASDFTARLVPALLGVFLAWFPWKFRDWLGTTGAIATSALILISPTLLYYSRFIREDIFAAAWIAIIVYGLWKYMDEGKEFHLYVMTAGWALLFSQKEISYLLAFVFWTFLALLFALRYFGRLGPRVATRDSREWHLLVLMGALFLPLATAVALHLPTVLNNSLGLSLPILDPGMVGGNSETSVYNDASRWPFGFNLRAYLMVLFLWLAGFAAAAKLWEWRKFLKVAAVFYTIFILFHTTFLTNLYGIGSGMVGALGYWIEQHGVRRGEQPWYYYMLLLPLYEFLPLLLMFGGGALLLRGRNERIVPDSDAPERHLSARALWPYFSFWWFAGTFAILTVAGEKMPWLLVHSALPLIFFAGWALGKFLDGIEWQWIREEGGLWFGLLFTVAVLAFLTVCWLLFTGKLPFQASDEAGMQITARWLLSLLVLGAVTWSAMAFSNRLGGRAASQVAILGITTLLALATVRFALIASFVNGDNAHEPLIFVQSSPRVTMLMEDLEAISERVAGDKNIHVAYDNFSSWPFEWYLRDYPNRFFYGSEPESYADAIRNSSVILVGVENEQKIKPLVQGYVRHEYPMRWWFPEDYKKLTQNVSETPDPNNPGQMITTFVGESESPITILKNIWRLAQQPAYREDFIDFVLNRRVTQPLGSSNFVVYIKPEVVAEVWGRQGSGTVRPTTPLAEAPYIDVTVPLESAFTLTSDFLSPRNVAVLPDGTLAVVDSGNHRIQLLDAEGTV